MKTHYDFRKAKRGPILQVPRGKTRITIRIDDDLLDWFRKRVHAAGGGSYQTLINLALRDYVTRKEERLEETLRRVLREELPGCRFPRTPGTKSKKRQPDGAHQRPAGAGKVRDATPAGKRSPRR
ncbi:MAG: BrnA antitoxin family protein [Candidatus Eisenbacteria bacterium]|nr:BrnA antitoxin family protein [Candidatus Eisenbacteria bacterium]